MKNGWQEKSLGDLAEIRYGFTESANPNPVGPKFLRITDIQNGRVDWAKVPYCKIEAADKGKYSLSDGDIVFARTGATTGKSFLITNPPDAVFASYLIKVRIRSDLVLPEFLYQFFQSSAYWETINAGVSGSAQGGFNAKKLGSLSVPIPPIEEQRRIVAILGEAFEAIDNAKQNTEKNLQNARELFESYLESVFREEGSGWERLSLEGLLQRGWIKSHLDGNHGSDYPRKEEFISEGVPYISANCLRDDQIDMSRAKYLAPERAAGLRKGIARDKDVLFAHNATVGPVAVLNTDEPKVVLGTSLTYYRCDQNQILPEYLAQYMRSTAFKSQYLQVMRQSTRNQVPITKQREFFHIIPPLDMQRKLVAKLDGIFENGRSLESVYPRKIESLNELKRSLLFRAFSSNL